MNLDIVKPSMTYRVVCGPKHQSNVSAFAYFAVAILDGKPAFLTPDSPFFHNEHQLMTEFAEEICKLVTDFSPIHCALTECIPTQGEGDVSSITD